ncbi:HNH endonuclease [Caballeronia sp. NK8]|uniref:HNH endonuclease n=1 Tax=Caballeronia sp. NK8 TaxID=140098 RepID=UPI001BB5879B|nr:HNH endonuclease [Caballeronia sp. NK8]BCQ23123.1 HNH endonuclease [Caballeronia sp. NK8]
MAERITLERLKQILSYEPDTGLFRWKVYRNAKVGVGDIAGTISAKGYAMIGTGGRLYQAHRLAWFYMTGAWPDHEIDHRNHIKTDNRFENLRQATKTDNNRNRRFKRNRSGFKGVAFNPRLKKWNAQIWYDGKQKHLGVFDRPEDAHEAYRAAAKEIHGEFATFEELP